MVDVTKGISAVENEDKLRRNEDLLKAKTAEDIKRTLVPEFERPSPQDGRIQSEIFAGIITDINNTNSIAAARKCIRSIQTTNSKLVPFIFPAVTPETLQPALQSFSKKITDWTWPVKPGTERIDLRSGLKVHAYGAKDPKKVVACLLSHMMGWRFSLMINTPIMILEHDAIFTRKFDYQEMPPGWEKRNCVIGLNNPLGATRKAHLYYEKVLNSGNSIADNKIIPDGWGASDLAIDTNNNLVKTNIIKRAHANSEGEKIASSEIDKKLLNPNMNSSLDNAISMIKNGVTGENKPKHFYREVPWVDDKSVPQGLAGNSAYLMNPGPARKLFEIIDDVGLWPNDALMCKQLMGGHLMRVVYPYYTTLQGVASTTQG